jgi:hypothetical protein
MDRLALRHLTEDQEARYMLSVHSRGRLPDVALARVAASGRRVAR